MLKTLIILLLQTNLLPTVKSAIDYSDDYYEKSINGYKKNEFWGNWAMPISEKYIASTTKRAEGKNFYSFKNAQDYNLNTAWIPKATDKNAYFEYIFKFPENNSYGDVYQFQGICNVFNGYCKSLKSWKDNSRIKKLLLFYNNTPICYVSLLDTWHFQSFDISAFFKNRRTRKNLDARFEIKSGDKLRFKIMDIYKGEKYQDVAISEFLCEGATN